MVLYCDLLQGIIHIFSALTDIMDVLIIDGLKVTRFVAAAHVSHYSYPPARIKSPK